MSLADQTGDTIAKALPVSGETVGRNGGAIRVAEEKLIPAVGFILSEKLLKGGDRHRLSTLGRDGDGGGGRDHTAVRLNREIAACDKTGVLMMSVFQSRFVKNVELIKQAVDAGRFGKIVLVSCQCKWFRTQEYYDSASWRGTWALDGGGALMNQSIHTIDLLQYLNGDVDEVMAATATLSHTGIEVEDNAVAILKYKNGALGTIEGSTSCQPGFPRRVEISGSLGSVVLEDNKLVRWQFVNEEPGDEEIRKSGGVGEVISGGGAGDPMAISSNGHRIQIEALAEAILSGRKKIDLDGREGRRAVALICSIYKSAKLGAPVKVC